MLLKMTYYAFWTLSALVLGSVIKSAFGQNTTVTCDFEDGHVCGWELEDGAPDHWRLGNGPVGSGPYALPNAAVGLGFIYVESNTLPTTGTPTEIDTRFQPPTESQFTFHYRTFGFGVASLALFLDTPDGTRYQLWHSPSDRREWQQAEVKICSLQSFKLVFEARFSGANFVVGLDSMVLASEAEPSGSTPPLACTFLDPVTTVGLPTSSTPRPTTVRTTTVRTSTTTVISTTAGPPSLPLPWQGALSCDFEAGSLCDWRNVVSNDVWLPAANGQSGINFDGATGGSLKFALAKFVAFDKSTARLLSPSILSTAETVSLEFYFRTSGRGSSGIQLYLIISGVIPSTVAWSSGTVMANQWNYANALLTFPVTSRRQILLQTRFTLANSWTALDDLTFEPPNQPQNSVSCDFEDGHLCGWDLEEGWPNHWRLSNGTVGAGPYALQGAAEGQGFVYVDSSALPSPGTPTEIDTHYQPAVESEFVFYYRAFGHGVASLVLFLDVERESRYALWHAQSYGREWQRVQLGVCSIQSFKLTFEARFTSTGFVVGLDSMTLASETEPSGGLPPTSCVLPDPEPTVVLPTTSTPRPSTSRTTTVVSTTAAAATSTTPGTNTLPHPWQGALSCDFEELTLCDWRNTVSNDVWSPASTENSSNINFDGSAGPGSRFAVARYLSPSASLARLLSPIVIFTATGSDVAASFKLNFYLRTSGRGSSGIQLYLISSSVIPGAFSWSTGSVVPNQWNYAETTIIQPMDVPHDHLQILLQSRFTLPNSYTALDDIVFLQTNAADLDTMSCDFENGHLCGWDLEDDSPNHWTLGNGPVGVGSYGLQSAAAGSGFVYVDSNALPSPGTPAEMDTHYRAGVDSALEFHYRAFGFGVASFVLYLDVQNGSRYAVWHAGQFGAEWQRARLNVCSVTTFKLTFEARFVSANFLVALDSIVLASDTESHGVSPTNCVLPSPEPTVLMPTTLPITTARISTATSVATTSMATTTAAQTFPEPWEGSASCNFESASLCDWRNLPSIGTWSSATNGGDINFDGVTGAGSKFALARFNTVSAAMARLLSPMIGTGITTTSASYSLDFYFRVSGRGSSGIQVFLITSGSIPNTVAWSSGTPVVNQWNHANALVAFPVGVERRQILLQTRFNLVNGWTAIDDLILMEEGVVSTMLTTLETTVPTTTLAPSTEAPATVPPVTTIVTTTLATTAQVLTTVTNHLPTTTTQQMTPSQPAATTEPPITNPPSTTNQPSTPAPTIPQETTQTSATTPVRSTVSSAASLSTMTTSSVTDSFPLSSTDSHMTTHASIGNPNPSDQGQPGFSESTKIGLGVGLTVGGVFLAALTVLSLRHWKRLKQESYYCEERATLREITEMSFRRANPSAQDGLSIAHPTADKKSTA